MADLGFVVVDESTSSEPSFCLVGLSKPDRTPEPVCCEVVAATERDERRAFDPEASGDVVAQGGGVEESSDVGSDADLVELGSGSRPPVSKPPEQLTFTSEREKSTLMVQSPDRGTWNKADGIGFSFGLAEDPLDVVVCGSGKVGLEYLHASDGDDVEDEGLG